MWTQRRAPWDVIAVTDMRGMVQGVEAFHQPLPLWNVSGGHHGCRRMCILLVLEGVSPAGDIGRSNEEPVVDGPLFDAFDSRGFWACGGGFRGL